MPFDRKSLPLRPILMADAAACLVMGIGLIGLAGPLEPLTGLSQTFAMVAGALLLPVAAFILVVASRPAIPAAGVAVIVAGNVGWIAASLLILATGMVQTTALGTTLVLAQAAAVAVITALEHAARPARIVGQAAI
ncbi:hypothetical protein [Chthonobacter albigriseus]|uniref:hypothetical protein n=1 Tax=Chthonobacter albigriseus TaxID=1683161 RepID=UPI0015EF9F6D|nr:hypothetical protein [Chthonobacter albigriseus]